MPAPTDAPLGLSWNDVVVHHVTEHGTWIAVAHELVRRMRLGGEEPPDPATVEKGLRRLASRANASGGQYGRWVLRHLGVPERAEKRLRWLAQYHSRFSDMPADVRLGQLSQWDRPPISESRAIGWVHVGLASVLHRQRAREACTERLAAALRVALPDSPRLALEARLLAARDSSDRNEYTACDEHLAIAGELVAALGRSSLSTSDREDLLCYQARLSGQRAFQIARRTGGVARARQLFLELSADSRVPFVDYRRTAGLAYCAWKVGDLREGARLARQAAEHAADGGYVRFRIMALNLLSRMVEAEEARALRERAARLAHAIGDVHLAEVAERALSA